MSCVRARVRACARACARACVRTCSDVLICSVQWEEFVLENEMKFADWLEETQLRRCARWGIVSGNRSSSVHRRVLLCYRQSIGQQFAREVSRRVASRSTQPQLTPEAAEMYSTLQLLKNKARLATVRAATAAARAEAEVKELDAVQSTELQDMWSRQATMAMDHAEEAVAAVLQARQARERAQREAGAVGGPRLRRIADKAQQEAVEAQQVALRAAARPGAVAAGVPQVVGASCAAMEAEYEAVGDDASDTVRQRLLRAVERMRSAASAVGAPPDCAAAADVQVPTLEALLTRDDGAPGDDAPADAHAAYAVATAARAGRARAQFAQLEGEGLHQARPKDALSNKMKRLLRCCPSRIVVTTDCEGKVRVNLLDVHIGHDRVAADQPMTEGLRAFVRSMVTSTRRPSLQEVVRQLEAKASLVYSRIVQAQQASNEKEAQELKNVYKAVTTLARRRILLSKTIHTEAVRWRRHRDQHVALGMVLLDVSARRPMFRAGVSSAQRPLRLQGAPRAGGSAEGGGGEEEEGESEGGAEGGAGEDEGGDQTVGDEMTAALQLEASSCTREAEAQLRASPQAADIAELLWTPPAGPNLQRLVPDEVFRTLLRDVAQAGLEAGASAAAQAYAADPNPLLSKKEVGSNGATVGARAGGEAARSHPRVQLLMRREFAQFELLLAVGAKAGAAAGCEAMLQVAAAGGLQFPDTVGDGTDGAVTTPFVPAAEYADRLVSGVPHQLPHTVHRNVT